MSNDVQSRSMDGATKYNFVQHQENLEDAEQAMFSLRSNGLQTTSF